jgi:hypothetical protein
MKSRTTATLKDSIERSILAYVTAASAVTGMAAVASSAQAEVIYTPAHVKLGDAGLNYYFLDIDHDGIADFTFRVLYGQSIVLSVVGVDYSQRIQTHSYGTGCCFVNARKIGGKIGPRKHFDGGNKGMAFETSQGGVFGPWADVKSRYVGMQLLTKNGVNYGWARWNVHFAEDHTLRATLTGYAYETEPDKPIVAGDEGSGVKSLGHLALGAAGKK